MSSAAPLRILIVDDETPARERLRTLLGDLAGTLPNLVVGEAADGVAALDAMQTADAGAVDLALVDVRMPRMDGLELAQHLARLDAPPAVVFTTAYDHYAVQAFELAAVDYLMKPIRAERLRQALAKAAERRRGAVSGISQVVSGGISGGPADGILNATAEGNSRGMADAQRRAIAALNPDARRYLSCHERGKLLLVPVAEVIYFRAETKYVAARTAQREYLLNDSLLALETEFGERFIRLHRGVIAAREALCGFVKGHEADGESEQWQALLNGVPDRLPISRRHWPAVKGFAKQLAGE